LWRWRLDHRKVGAGRDRYLLEGDGAHFGLSRIWHDANSTIDQVVDGIEGLSRREEPSSILILLRRFDLNLRHGFDLTLMNDWGSLWRLDCSVAL
jgi:hypothetical protein